MIFTYFKMLFTSIAKLKWAQVFLVISFVSQASCNYKLIILHNNDFHSRFAPTTVDGSPCDEAKQQCIAGVTRTVHEVSCLRIRRKTNNNFNFRSKESKPKPKMTFYSWLPVISIKDLFGTRPSSTESLMILSQR